MCAVEGKPFVPQTVADVQKALASDLDPPADLYTSAQSKLHLARVLTGRTLAGLDS
jgi:CO/xanthine dehydrogenase FAD-binding subunit